MKDKYYNLEYIYIGLGLMTLLLLDLGTKYLFYDLGLYSNTLLLEPTKNIGISFSWGVPYSIVIPLSLLALGGFIYLYQNRILPKFATIFLIAGTLGNFYDRIIYNGVRDFLVMPGWFIFNIADLLLTIAIFLICRHIVYKKNI